MEKQAVESRRDYLNVILCILDGFDDFELTVKYDVDNTQYPISVKIRMLDFCRCFLNRIPIHYTVFGCSGGVEVYFRLPMDCSELR